MNDSNKLTKGERTAQRLMDVAERLFAERGFGGTSLRDVANAAGIKEPGIYNHFANKEALYYAVLERGLRPLANAMDVLLAGEPSPKALAELPAVMTDMLAEHPSMPALFQQALMNREDGHAQTLMDDWLGQLFTRGRQVMYSGERGESKEHVLRLIAMFNLCSGYFLSQRVMDKFEAGSVLAPENLVRQKRLLGKIIRLFLLE
jgi:AcrR family transcriptional regulator